MRKPKKPHNVFQKARGGAAQVEAHTAAVPEKPKGKAPKGKPAAEWLHLSEIRPWVKNPRVNDGAVPKIVRSIREFGFPTAMVLNAATGDLIAGHTRMKAMCSILAETPDFTLDGAPGPGYVPVRRHTFRDENQAYAYAVADNRLAEEAEWDDALLRERANAIIEEEGLAFLGVVGFDDDEVGRILADPGIPMEGDEGVGGPTPPPTPSGAHASPEGRPAPPNVRLVQLLMTEDQFAEYTEHLGTLRTILEVTEPVDVVLGAMRATAAQGDQ